MATANLKIAAIDTTASGDTTVVAAVASQVVRVYGWLFVAGGATSVQWKDGTKIALTGAMPMLANGSQVVEEQAAGDPWLIATAGNALVLNQSAAVQLGGTVLYTQL